MSVSLAAFAEGFAKSRRANQDRAERDEERKLTRERIEADLEMARSRPAYAPDEYTGERTPANYAGGSYGGEEGGGFSGTSAQLIADFESYRDNPYWDVNAYRAGFGSDTTTLADGTVVPIKQGMTVTREDSLRDLDRRISTEFRPSAMNAIGADSYQELSPQQQAVLDSLAYNYGAHAWDKGLAPVRKAIQSGGDVASAIASLGAHNEGVNLKRREREASIWSGGSYRPAATPTRGRSIAREAMPAPAQAQTAPAPEKASAAELAGKTAGTGRRFTIDTSAIQSAMKGLF